MPQVLGLVLALPAEAKAVVGKQRWHRRDRLWVCQHRVSPDLSLLCVRAGTGPENALFAARWLTRQRVSALAVTGVSGGLQADLTPGDLVVADRVCRVDGADAGRCWNSAKGYSDLLSRQLSADGLRVFRGAIVTSATPVLTPKEKDALFSRNGALAVDMESAAVALAAEEATLPFFALRAICDPAPRAIPSDLADALNREGTVSPTVLFSKLCRRPLLALDLIRLGRDFASARKTLRRAWRIQLGCSLPSQIRQDTTTAEATDGLGDMGDTKEKSSSFS